MSWSFRTNGNFIDFVHTDETSLAVENVIVSLHNTSKCIDWSLPADTTRISFTIDEIKYSNIPITDIDFDGTAMNSQDDFETGIEAMFPGLAGGAASYLVYTALISQAATDNPTVIVLGTNTIGNIVWTRAGTGFYKGTLTGAFPENKTWAIVAANPQETSFAGLNRINDNEISLEIAFTTTGDYGDDLLTNNPIEIRVYP